MDRIYQVANTINQGLSKVEQNELTLQIKSLVRENATLRALVVSLDKLCSCYRLTRNPPDALLSKIHMLRDELYATK